MIDKKIYSPLPCIRDYITEFNIFFIIISKTSPFPYHILVFKLYESFCYFSLDIQPDTTLFKKKEKKKEK